MKKLFLTLSVLIIYNVANAQAPSWQWAKSAGGPNDEKGYKITTDQNGNVLATGYFRSNSLAFGTSTLTNAASSYYDAFVVKYDPAGNLLWVRSAGSNNDDYGYAITTDASGNVFIAGSFAGTSINFGTMSIANSFTPGPIPDFYLAKYDANGNFLWARSAAGPGLDVINGIDIDQAGNVVVSGLFYGASLNFGTATLANVNPGSPDVFIAKYTTAGNFVWATSMGGSSSDENTGVSVDLSGNIFVAGIFTSPSITFGTTTLANAGNLNSFIAKYDMSGNFIWARTVGASGYAFSTSVFTDAYGNAVLAGYYGDPTLVIGTSTLVNTMSNNSQDIYIVKYNAAGNVMWARSAGGTYGDYCNDVCIDASSNILIAGSFFGSSMTFGTSSITNAGGDDIFVAKYDSNGNLIWVKSTGDFGDDQCYGVAADASGNVAVTGNFLSPSFPLGTTTLMNAGSHDIFVAKLAGSTGIVENFSDNKHSVYPNPTSGIIHVGLNNCESAEIMVCDVLGNCVLKRNCANEANVKLDLNNQPRGMYFVKTISENERSVTKIILE